MSEKPVIKAEKVLAELNRLRADLSKDPTDIEWFTLHHVFCFVSYKHGRLPEVPERDSQARRASRVTVRGTAGHASRGGRIRYPAAFPALPRLFVPPR
jgi:hypothetical protein